MKDNIGLASNILAKRRACLKIAGKIQHTGIMSDIIGSTTYGIAGAGQAVIDIQKHTTDMKKHIEEANYWKNTNVSNKTGRQEAKEQWINRHLKAFGEELPEYVKNELPQITTSRQYAEYTFEAQDQPYNQVLNKMKTSSKAKNVFDRLTRTYLGQSDATMLDNAINMTTGDAAFAQASLDNTDFKKSIFSTGESPVSDFMDLLKRKSKLQEAMDSPVFRKSGKFAAIAAGVALATNFFSPLRPSTSMNPGDMFSDLGDNNIFNSSLELDRSVPLNSVDPSFSKQAFIKMSGYKANNYSQNAGAIINKMLKSGFMDINVPVKDFGGPVGSRYTNYTNNMTYFGSPDLYRKSQI
jgi:hypothetical protein